MIQKVESIGFPMETISSTQRNRDFFIESICPTDVMRKMVIRGMQNEHYHFLEKILQ